jgi:hypothetical protein
MPVKMNSGTLPKHSSVTSGTSHFQQQPFYLKFNRVFENSIEVHVVFLALQPIVVVFSQPSSGL